MSRTFPFQFPVALIGLALVVWKLPEPQSQQTLDSWIEDQEASKLSRIDFAGAVTLVGTVLTGLLSVDVAMKGEMPLVAASLIIVFLISLVSFVLVEKYYAEEPILPLALISQRDVLTSYLIVGLQSAGQFGVSHSSISRSYSYLT